MYRLNYSKFSYFRAAPIAEEDWHALTEAGIRRTLPRGSLLRAQAQPVTELLCVLKGRTKSLHVFPNGNVRLNEILEAPALFGHEALFAEGMPAWFPNIVAITAVEVSAVPLAAAEALLRQRPQMLLPLFQTERNALSMLRVQSSWVLHLDLTQRTAYAICQMRGAQKDEEGFVRITHEELGHYLGMSRTNVTTALNRLERMGLISKKQGRLRIDDINGLYKLTGISDWKDIN